MASAKHNLAISASELLSPCLTQLQDELARIGVDILAKNEGSMNPAFQAKLTGPPTPFLETIDALHNAASLAPSDLVSEVKSKAFGAENLWALSSGFLRAVASTNGTLPVVCFDVTCRHTGRTVPVALPTMHYNLLAEEINKFVRKLKKFRKEIHRG